MTKQKKHKKRVRARMEVAGETFTKANEHVEAETLQEAPNDILFSTQEDLSAPDGPLEPPGTFEALEDEFLSCLNREEVHGIGDIVCRLCERSEQFRLIQRLLALAPPGVSPEEAREQFRRIIKPHWDRWKKTTEIVNLAEMCASISRLSEVVAEEDPLWTTIPHTFDLKTPTVAEDSRYSPRPPVECTKRAHPDMDATDLPMPTLAWRELCDFPRGWAIASKRRWELLKENPKVSRMMLSEEAVASDFGDILGEILGHGMLARKDWPDDVLIVFREAAPTTRIRWT
jgi:hypothetical protein